MYFFIFSDPESGVIAVSADRIMSCSVELVLFAGKNGGRIRFFPSFLYEIL